MCVMHCLATVELGFRSENLVLLLTNGSFLIAHYQNHGHQLTMSKSSSTSSSLVLLLSRTISQVAQEQRHWRVQGLRRAWSYFNEARRLECTDALCRSAAITLAAEARRSHGRLFQSGELNCFRCSEYEEKGRCHLRNREFDEAKMAFDRAIEYDPGNVELYCLRSSVLRRLKQDSAALIDAETAIQLDPCCANGWNNKGLCLFDLKEFEKAKEAMDKAIELDADLPVFHYNRCNANLMLNEYKLALKDATSAVQLDSSFGAAWNEKGLCHFELGESKQALRALDNAINAEPKNASFLCNRSSVLFNLGRFTAALKDADAALDLLEEGRQNAETWNQKARCHFELKDYQAARIAWDAAIKLDPHNAVYHCNRSRAYIEQREYSFATRDARKATELNPKHAEAWYCWGLCFFEVGRHYEAKTAFDEAIRRNNRNASYYVFRSNTLLELEEYNGALKDASKATNLDPLNPLTWNQRGLCFFKLGKYRKARESYDTAISLAPGNASLYASRCLVYIKLNSHFSALKDANKAIALHSDRADYWNYKGFCHYILQEFFEASDAYKTGLSIDPMHYKCQHGLAATLHSYNGFTPVLSR
eukprot:Protomagalhaensia_sp_Gyna_25__3312@NODE_2_length_10425_cov_76_179954_g1_i0_p2_GENE_NODE_2_length_10425_cov_76_179954_g1_i0NODE_2_length_10425_cov_76_179954_g1_i0_p2_ORF_typecomplete_len592_score105_02TPR_16/PF13432_6/1_7e08TPR_16/PF13432_6/9_2e09TPR_16/PF13432_6/4_7e08TPR_16/PF13432_6/5e07TPR_16/PF13432_6/1_1e10TPR_16/PF13432_6/3_9e11TPR_16/PF13432_6/1e10TPR_16/PF13432_6/0_00014TPR_1/PF00515_28/0_0027TPR_1/PF00515_28/3_8TPR_1/PF00515_28/1_8e08TPR_1/PF00515_28/0_02TPR_1/PF00515_28/0_0037TPR_1/PF0